MLLGEGERMTKPQEFPLKRVVMDIHDRVKCLEAMVEQLSASQMIYDAHLAELAGTNRMLAGHVLRLVRQKDVLLEAIGRQAFGGDIDWTLIAPPPTSIAPAFKPSAMEPRR
jgi:hypothetical protein